MVADAPSKMTAAKIAKYIDHTLLNAIWHKYRRDKYPKSDQTIGLRLEKKILGSISNYEICNHFRQSGKYL